MGIFKKKSGGLSNFGKLFVSKKDPTKSSIFGKVLNTASDVVGAVVGTIGNVVAPGGASVVGAGISAGTRAGVKAIVKTSSKMALKNALKVASKVALTSVNLGVSKAVTGLALQSSAMVEQEKADIKALQQIQAPNQLGSSTETYTREEQPKQNNILLWVLGGIGLFGLLKMLKIL
jgi:hypothetical protein